MLGKNGNSLVFHTIHPLFYSYTFLNAFIVASMASQLLKSTEIPKGGVDTFVSSETVTSPSVKSV